jgi:hypothetical protein
MRTILRTYHAIPCLQKSEAAKKHLQGASHSKLLFRLQHLLILRDSVIFTDAPRMKAALKGVVLDAERLNVPFTIAEVEKKTVSRPKRVVRNNAPTDQVVLSRFG